nr:ROK family protein [uncultured Undibacterium sp.]
MILAIDLGGTKTQAALFHQEEMRWCIYEKTNAETVSDLIAHLEKIIRQSRAQLNGNAKIDAVAIGVPGPVAKNVMYGSAPLGTQEIIDFSARIREMNLVGEVPVIVKNDLQMAGYSELYRGYGRDYKNFCLVSLSTGIGIAPVLNGHLLEGKFELGHQILAPDLSPALPCTNHENCWVALASGSGIAARFGKLGASSTEAIFSSVLSDHDIRQLRRYNAQGFGTIVGAYDPEAIVIMGSLGLQQFEKIIPDMEELSAFTINRPLPIFLKTKQSDDIGIWGAYFVAKEFLSQ